MTPAAFRKIALSMPEAVEKAHMGHPDFRVGGRVFATLLGSHGELGMVKVAPARQRRLMKSHPGVFWPAAGAWGKRGCTLVDLSAAGHAVVRAAIAEAWSAAAPPQAVEIHGEQGRREKPSSRGARGGPATRGRASRTRPAARRARS